MSNPQSANTYLYSTDVPPQGNGAQPGDQADAEQPRGVAAGDQLTICDQLRNIFGPSFNASDDGDCAQPIEVARDDSDNGPADAKP